MIEVTATLFPYEDRSSPKVLGKIHIINDGTGNQETGNYIVKFFSTMWNLTTKKEVETFDKEVYIKDYPRLEYPIWELVKRCLYSKK
jgi:hypothetical protein